MMDPIPTGIYRNAWYVLHETVQFQIQGVSEILSPLLLYFLWRSFLLDSSNHVPFQQEVYHAELEGAAAGEAPLPGARRRNNAPLQQVHCHQRERGGLQNQIRNSLQIPRYPPRYYPIIYYD